MKNIIFDEVLNMRASTAGRTVLQPVPAPGIIAPSGWSPLLRHAGNVLVCSGNTLAVAHPDSPVTVAELPSPPLCAAVHGSRITVMTARGPYTILYDPVDCTYRPVGLPVRWPQITLGAVRGGVYSCRIPSVTVARVADACRDAYVELAESAHAAGAFLQPVLASVQLLDAAGNVLHATPPVFVAPTDGTALCDPLGFTFADSDTGKDSDRLNALDISASGYRITVDMADVATHPRAADISRIRVMVTPQFHPWNFSAGASVARTGSVSGAPPLTVVPPTAMRDVCRSVSVSAQGLIVAAWQRFDDVAVIAAEAVAPFGTLTADAPPVVSVRKSADDFFNALSSPAAARTVLPPLFSATHCAVSANAAVWANPTPLRALTANPGCFAADVADRRWYGQLRIAYADGTSTVTDVSGGKTPLSLLPLVTVPDSDAVRLTLRFFTEGDDPGADNPYLVELPLTPAGDACAFWLSDDRRPVAVDRAVDRAELPVAVTAGASVQNAILTARADAVASPLARITVPAAVTAVVPARDPSGGWLFGRRRFYVFTADCTYVLTLAADMRDGSLSPLYPAGVPGAHCVADTPDGVCALCGGDIVRLASSSVRVLRRGVSADRLGYCADHSHLVAGNTDDNVAVHIPDDGSVDYTTTLVIRGAWLSDGGAVFTVTDRGLADLNDRTDRLAPVPVALRVRLTPSPSRRRLPARVTVPLRSDRLDGTLTLSRHYIRYGQPADVTVASLRIAGRVLRPLTLRVVPPLWPSTQYALALVADASPATSLAL